MQTVTTIGLDIAKSVFQVHGVDAAQGVGPPAVEAPPCRDSPWLLPRPQHRLLLARRLSRRSRKLEADRRSLEQADSCCRRSTASRRSPVSHYLRLRPHHRLLLAKRLSR